MKVRSIGFAILRLFTSVGIFKFSLIHIFYAGIFNHLTILQGLHFLKWNVLSINLLSQEDTNCNSAQDNQTSKQLD